MAIIDKLQRAMNKKNMNENKENNQINAPFVCVLSNFYEVERIAHYLVQRRSVIVNLTNLKNNDKYRVIDFLSGVIYTFKGKRQKLESNIYLFSS